MIHRNTLALAAALGMACTIPAFADATSADMKAKQVFATIAETPAEAPDKLFVAEAAMGNLWESKFSELVASKAQNPQVKEQAMMIKKDHAAANEKLIPIAQKMGLDLPTELTSQKQAKLDVFAAMQPEQLEKAFLMEMKAGHMKDVTSYADHEKAVKDADLRGYISSTLPKLREHTQHVVALATEMGVGQPAMAAGHDHGQMQSNQGTASDGDAGAAGTVSADGSSGTITGPEREPNNSANARD